MQLLLGSYKQGLYSLTINKQTSKFENLTQINDREKTSYLNSDNLLSYIYLKDEQYYINIETEDVTLYHSATHLSYLESQNAMLVSFYNNGLFKVLRKRPNWRISEQFSYPKGSHIHYSSYIPNTNLIGVVDLGLNKIYFYNNITPLNLNQVYDFDEGIGPRHFINNLDLPIIYVLTEHIPMVIVLMYENGIWQEVAKYPLEKGAGSAIRVTSDNKHLFAAVRDSNKIYHFNILKDGTLKFVNSYDTLGDHPRDFNIFLDKYLVIANMKSDNLTLYVLEDNQLILKESNFKANAIAAIISKWWLFFLLINNYF